MPSSSSALTLVLAVAVVASSSAFAPTRIGTASSPTTALRANNNVREKQWTVDETAKESPPAPLNVDKFNFPNPLAEIGNMFSSLDDVIDDFFNKRVSVWAVACTSCDHDYFYIMTIVLTKIMFILLAHYPM